MSETMSHPVETSFEPPVFMDQERKRALDWLATKATRQTIKDQIDWLKRQVETRKTRPASESAA